MEGSGFKVYKNFKTSQKVLDIYAILPTTVGDFGVVVACKNYDKDMEVGIDVLKEMEEIGNTLQASKVAIITSSYYTQQASNYALRKNIKLVDRSDLIKLAKKYSSASEENYQEDYQSTLDNNYEDSQVYYKEEDEVDYVYDDYDLSYLERRNNNPLIYNTNRVSLHKQDNNSLKPKKSLFSRKSNFNSFSNFNSKSLPNYKSKSLPSNNSFSLPSYELPKKEIDWMGIINPLIQNPVISIILIIAIAFALSFVLGNLLKIPAGILGLIELVVALILSYGFAYYAKRDQTFIIRGTVMFFISLAVLIILILI